MKLWPTKSTANGTTRHDQADGNSSTRLTAPERASDDQSGLDDKSKSDFVYDCAATNDLPRLVGELHPELVSQRFLDLVPRDFARQHLIISQTKGDPADSQTPEAERLAISQTTNVAALYNVGVLLGSGMNVVIADGEAIARLIDQVYTRSSDSALAGESTLKGIESGNIDRLLAEADKDLLSTEGKGPVIKLVDGLLFEALGRNSSDVHIQPLADRTLVRYRLDGVLHTVGELPSSLTSAVISRIKVMGRMDIAERRMPQDGRATVLIGTPALGKISDTNSENGLKDASHANHSHMVGSRNGGRSIDLRISTLPTSYGERAVIRLLDNANHLCDFQQLGMPPDVSGPYLERACRANGMILLTGPTGSGKTTTLYSTLRQIGSSEINILTIEDPIEYELSTVGLAISQSQVNPRKGVTFATGLRHILRQDPDVVMVGEIRDAETARIAIQSSLTGHLVFSTLHTNDSPSAVTRLLDLGIEPYLVSASLSAVLAQRLVRKFHVDCHGKGCEGCFGTGFSGRCGLFELLAISDTIRELIATEAALAQIRQAARSEAMRTLKERGDELVTLGITSQAEVDRVVHGAI